MTDSPPQPFWQQLVLTALPTVVMEVASTLRDHLRAKREAAEKRPVAGMAEPGEVVRTPLPTTRT